MSAAAKVSRRGFLQTLSAAISAQFLPGAVSQPLHETMIFHSGEVTPAMQAAMPIMPKFLRKMEKECYLSILHEENKSDFRRHSRLELLCFEDGEFNLPNAMTVYKFSIGTNVDINEQFLSFFKLSFEDVRSSYQDLIGRQFSKAVQFIPSKKMEFYIIPTYNATVRDLEKLDAWSRQSDCMVMDIAKINRFKPSSRPLSQKNLRELEEWMHASAEWLADCEKIAPSRGVEVVRQPV